MKKILFVDDEARFLRSLSRLFRDRKEEWNLFFARSFDDAVVMFNQHDFDLIIIDIKLSKDVDGFKFLELINEQASDNFVPSIILTGAIEPEFRYKALEMGAVDIVYKPVEKVDLIARIENCLGLKAQFDRVSLKQEAMKEELTLALKQTDLVTEISSYLGTIDDFQQFLQLCSESVVTHLDGAFTRIWLVDEKK